LGTNADAILLTKEINVTIKTQIISVVIFIVILIGIALYVDGPGRGSRRGYDMIGSGYVMMGGYEAGHGMMEEYGSSDNKRYSRDAWYRPRLSPREYDQNFSNLKEEIESLRNRSQEKRKELSSLLRSGKADKALIEKKSEELEDLERYLDQKISSRNTQQ
jgi:hypothetical protein